MWIKTTKELIYPDEPAIGSMTETELMEEPNEGREAFIHKKT